MQATKTFYTRIVFISIFTLTHHLPTISASVSDLSLSTISSSPSSSPLLVSLSAITSPSSSLLSTPSSSRARPVVVTDIATAKSSDTSTKTKDLFAIENDVAATATAKEISISESVSSAAASSTLSVQLNAAPSSSSSSQDQEKLPTRRQTRSLFYAYPYGTGLYANLYTGCVTCTTYYPTTSYAYSYAYYPTFHKFWGVYNPYYGYPRVIYG